MNKERLLYTVAGAAVALTSVALVAGYSVRKAKQKSGGVGLLLAGLAGLAVGAALAYKPELDAKRGLTVDELFNDGDMELMQQNISEVLGVSAEQAEAQRAPRREIELDEEATIEDFLSAEA